MVDDSGNAVEYPLFLISVTCLIAALNFFAFLGCFFFLISLLTSKKKGIICDAYNLYIFFLIIPDAFMTLIQGIVDIIKIRTNRGGPNFPPYFLNVFICIWFFYFTSNLYLNAIVTYEMNILIHQSYRRIKTPPPKLGRVLIQVISVYTFAFLLALWVGLDVYWSPIHIVTDNEKGSFILLGSFQKEDGTVIFSENVSSAIAFISIGIPIIYVIAVRILIWRNKLLPKSGRTRVLSLFFMRIIIVFLAFYLPNTIISSLVNKEKSLLAIWGRQIAALLTALQALVTLYIFSYKEDISQVIQEFVARNKLFCRLQKTTELVAGDHYLNEISREDDELQNRRRKSQWDEEDIYDENPAEGIEEKISTTETSFQKTEKI